jgi:hypothetical protein
MNDDKLVLDFFLGVGYDSSNRSINDVLAFDEHNIESHHDFIQWIFPTKERSAYNQGAPIISGDFRNILFKSNVAQDNFCKTCKMFLSFCGFNCSKSTITDTQAYEKTVFVRPSHNLLRITRVLNSLNQTGHENCSEYIFSQLECFYMDNPQSIPIESFAIWKNTQKGKEI